LEFEEFMSQLGVFLARQELRVVFDNFDANKDGNIAYAEFVNVLRVSKRHSYSINLPSFIAVSFVFSFNSRIRQKQLLD